MKMERLISRSEGDLTLEDSDGTVLDIEHYLAMVEHDSKHWCIVIWDIRLVTFHFFQTITILLVYDMEKIDLTENASCVLCCTNVGCPHTDPPTLRETIYAPNLVVVWKQPVRILSHNM